MTLSILFKIWIFAAWGFSW